MIAIKPVLRLATAADATAIEALMKESVKSLFPQYYDERQTASCVEYVAVVDDPLIADGTYFVVTVRDEIVGCGGWSRRDRLYTGSGDAAGGGRILDPGAEPAKIRAMFVRPDWTRRGLGRMIIDAAEDAARHEGYRRLALMATLPGVPLYEACGFHRVRETDVILTDGVEVACVAMEKALLPTAP